jgi:hypothetical protein
LYNADNSLPNGVYTIDPLGDGNAQEFFCLMSEGGWTLVMSLKREPDEYSDGFTLDVADAVETMPMSDPYTVPAAQSKVSNAYIAALQRENDDGTYNWMFDNFQWADSRTSPPNYPADVWPPEADVVATWDDDSVTQTSDYVRGMFSLTASTALIPGETKLVGAHMDQCTHHVDPGGNLFNPCDSNNGEGQHQYDSSTAIYDLTNQNSGSGTHAYAAPCFDAHTGPYTYMSSYNCYHGYTLVYVK